MDLTTATVTATPTVVKTTEPEPDTPTRNQPTPFTNGVLKRHAPLHLHHGHPVVVTYKECLKNHAAAMGGHAVDGCGEFMPSPSSNPSDPTSLKCAACGCHRNFHRRDPDVTATLPPPAPALEYQPHHRHLPPPPRVSPNDDNNPTSPNDSPSPPPISSTYPHMLLALSGQQGHHHQHVAAAAAGVGHIPPAVLSHSTRKRFRTKFTQDQKEKMLEFAEKVGWKMQKRDEDLINDFLNGIGVDKGVFKVWMHNNKNTFAKKDQLQISTSPNTTTSNAALSSSPFTATINTVVLPGVNTTTSMGDNNDNLGSNGVNMNIYGEEMRTIHIQNLSQEQQIPVHGHHDQDVSTGTSGTGHGAGTNGSNSSSS